MILQGSQRGGAKNLALHLLKQENEHVEVFDLRGFVSGDLVSALQESYAISRATKCKQHLFSLSLNPPPQEKVATAVFEDAVRRVEKELGLTDQPRAIVFHEKNGRRHAHAVWSRIDAEAMKAVQLSFTKRKLMDISRELYIEQKWEMPRGLMASERRDPTNYSLAQWQQAKRSGKDPRATKAAFQDCWAVSDTQGAFAAALKERGFLLARGDRRGFVAIDHQGEVYSIAKWVGIKTREVRSKLSEAKELPSVSDARERMSRKMIQRLDELKRQRNAAIEDRLRSLEKKRQEMAAKHCQARAELTRIQEEREQQEALKRQRRLRTGFRGLFDRFTGRRKKIVQANEADAYKAAVRNRTEKDQLIYGQLAVRQTLQRRIERLDSFQHASAKILERDIKRYDDMRHGLREVFESQSTGRQRTHDGPIHSR